MGCYNLGKLYKNGNTSESKYVGKGIVGNILEYLYESRNGVRQDYNKAMEFFGKACEMGYALGCGVLAYLYYIGDGVRQDYNKAMEFFGKACDLGDQDACMIIEQ